LRVVWVLLAILLLGDVGFTLRGRPTALVDISYSARVLFGESTLDSVSRLLGERGFTVRKFGSDTLSDIYSALKEAPSPSLLVSDGMHNAPGDPLAVAAERDVSVLLLPAAKVPARITHVLMRNPAIRGEMTTLRVRFSAPPMDTVRLTLDGREMKVFARDEAIFSFKVSRAVSEATITTAHDTVSFKVFAREPRGVGILAWLPLPVVRFVRWHLTDASFRLVREGENPEGKYSFVVMVDPPPSLLNVDRPALYFVGERSGFKAYRGKFFLRGNLPAIEEIYVPDMEMDRIYEKVGNVPIIASKGNALFVLTPDIWKVWLASNEDYRRFLDYLDDFVVRDYEIYTDKPLYARGERMRLHIYPPFPMEVSINGGKPITITSFYTYERRITPADTLFIVDIFRRGKRIASESVRVSVRSLPMEKVYLGYDTTFLKNLAAVSGGYVFRDVEEAAEVLRRRGGRRISLASLWPLFILFLLAAWTEWFIRRIRGML